MNILFVSNYLNHHQKELCEEIIRNVDQFHFVETDENHQQGFQTRIWDSYILQYRGNEKAVEALLIIADVVIFGACPNHLIDMRMRENKLSFLYSERFLKKGLWRRFIPQTRKKIIQRVVQYKDRNLYVLCASAFLANDLKLLGFPTGKCYKWGYFPETKHYQTAELFAQKNKQKILWVGRLLGWKHPEMAINLAELLKNDGFDFELDIIGDGNLKNSIEEEINMKQLDVCVNLLGSKTPEEVREYMEKSHIFISTSDFYEGWGAVLNEAMNSGCAVVASHAAGSTPYLVEDSVNGLIYKSGNMNELYEKVKYLLDNPSEQERLGKAAYDTIVNKWNAEVAAERLVDLSEHLLSGDKYSDLYQEGPCSRAEIIKNSWYKQ